MSTKALNMSGVNKDVELNNFFIFNSEFGSNEDQLDKLIYYYPIFDNTKVQQEMLGLVQGIIQFTQTFKPSKPVGSLHCTKFRQLYFQPEPNYWLTMTLSVPVVTKVKDNTNTLEYLEDDLQDDVYDAVLKQTYSMYRLFWGKFNDLYIKSGLEGLKNTVDMFFNAYLKTLKIGGIDISNTFGGIQYLPLDRQTFLKIQCFVNCLESKWSYIKNTACLFNEHVIWSGIGPNDMQTIYQYLIGTLLPANVETELQGGSIPRNTSSPFVPFRHGRFITGPTNLKQARTIGKIPKIYLLSDERSKEYHFVVYRALNVTVCLFIEGSTTLTLDDFKSIDEFMDIKLTPIANDTAEYCIKVTSPSSSSETSPRFMYFNKLNLAYKSTVHLDSKQSGNIACTKDSLRIMADMRKVNEMLGTTGENIVKTTNDYWVFSKSSNYREFYIVLLQKNASLIEISEEVKKLYDSELEGLFFHPM